MASKIARLLDDLQCLADELDGSFHESTDEIIRDLRRIIGKYRTDAEES